LLKAVSDNLVAKQTTQEAPQAKGTQNSGSSDSDTPTAGNASPSASDATVDLKAQIERITAKEGLRALLVYRAVLYGAFLGTCADISCVAGTELGSRIVQFL
jgi:hypothetical protein